MTGTVTQESTERQGSATAWLSHDAYQSQKYMPALDGVRGLAVALVVTCHLHEQMWTFLSGYVGVTLFFVLSGYLITRLALVEEAARGRINVRAFFIRRTFRIFPLYYLVLALYAVLILALHLWPAKTAPFRSALPFYLAYLQEVPFWTKPLLVPDAPFYHSWSLGVEEKFYLVWPLLMLAVPHGRVRWRFLLSALCALLCVLQGLRTEGLPAYHLQDYGFIFFGVCLALLLSRPRPYLAFLEAARALAPLAGAVLLLTQFYLMQHTRLRGLSTAYALAATVLLGALVSSRGTPSRLLSMPWLVWLGRLSYAIYLIHILCLGVVELVFKPGGGKTIGVLAYLGTLLLSTGLAYGLHLAVERPMIQLGRRLSNRAEQARPEQAPLSTLTAPHLPQPAAGSPDSRLPGL